MLFVWKAKKPNDIFYIFTVVFSITISKITRYTNLKYLESFGCHDLAGGLRSEAISTELIAFRDQDWNDFVC